MHRYFILPVSIFFILIILLVLYFQFYDDEWKYFFKPKDKIIPEYCNDNEKKIKKNIIRLQQDKSDNRSFLDKKDQDENLIHLIYFVPCDQISRDLDINNRIVKTIRNINKWFSEKSNKQKIKFDYEINSLDITFMRVNKTLKWFNLYNSKQNSSDDNSSKVEKIYIALDSDAIKSSLKFCETFMNEGKEVHLLEMDDKDPSELGFKRFTKLIQKSTPLTLSGLLARKLAL